MKATALLEQQHREVESIFEQLESGKGNAKLVEQLADNLTAHAIIEEQIFYPAAMKIEKDLVLESYEEHEVMAFALKRLVATDPKDESFEARVKAVKDLVEHHVDEEEEAKLFPAVDKAMSDEDSEALGEQMETRFTELVELGHEAALALRTKSKRTTNGQRSRTASPTSKKKTSQSHRKAA